MSRRLLILALLAAGTGALLAADETAPPAAAPAFDPATGCRCHDGLHPEGKAQPIDLRGWVHDGVHRAQGCDGCHLVGDPAAPHAMPLTTVACSSCHADEAKAFEGDVHAAAQGKSEHLQGCANTCHTEHQWYPATDPRGRYLPTGLDHSCSASQCHAPRLVDPLLKLPVKPRPDGSPWPTGPHGFLVSGDFRYVTQCQSCHGQHGVFPASDPRSKVNPARIEETCGPCHEGATAAAVDGRICYVPGQAAWAFRSYFDVWYLWFGGLLAATAAAIGAALVVESVVRRRRGPAAGPRDGTDAA
ncbi:MAG: hypothetical protein MUF27_05730 [Acidobacteria bacterium]|jgi:hypothetical protein|nr:hypothetical protein [Acidobacteriota bacterium]